MKQYRFVVILSLILILSSCFKEDDKIPPHQPGDIQTQTIAMGSYYETQMYFDLSANKVVSSNSKDIYDLRFACNDSTWLIRLNSAKFSRLAPTNDTSFFVLKDTTGMDWYYDPASGNPDSVAIDGWMEINGTDTLLNQQVFILDMGISSMGNTQGIKKLRILSINNQSYEIEYANLDNSGYYRKSISKIDGPAYVQIRLENGESPLDLEPNQQDWDMLFTPYTDILTTSLGEKYPYLVTGVLLNPNLVIVAMDSTLNFNELNRDDISSLNFSSMQNAIGYKWKWYDFDASIYTVLTKNVYIIRDVEGFYYKLRFIGFYNINGEKGYPKFEYQQL
jgi:hypothetical protein